jgi:ubiquinone/menaquinone biosynthesis C-methylase UbiE
VAAWVAVDVAAGHNTVHHARTVIVNRPGECGDSGCCLAGLGEGGLFLSEAEVLSPARCTVSSLHQGFQPAGQPGDAEGVFGWLDRMDVNPLIRQVKQLMLDACPVREGDCILDVGCGLGHEARRLAERAGPDGRSVGIDANPAMITEARQRAADLPLPLTFDVGDACHVDLPDSTFDLCRTERVLRYLDSPQTAVGEMARLARPGGSMLAFDFDSDQTVVDAPDPALARRIAEVLDAAVPHPWIGRQLFGLFRRAGLQDVRVIPHALCFSGAAGFAVYQQLNRGTIDRARQAGQVTADEVADWWAALIQAAETETFFSAVLGFIAARRKP